MAHSYNYTIKELVAREIADALPGKIAEAFPIEFEKEKPRVISALIQHFDPQFESAKKEMALLSAKVIDVDAGNLYIIKRLDEQKSDLKDIRVLLMGIVDKQGRSDGKDDANGKIIKGVLGTGLLGGIVGWIAKHFHLWGI